MLCKCVKVHYIQMIVYRRTQVYVYMIVFVMYAVCTSVCVCTHTSVCAHTSVYVQCTHKCMCPGGAERARAFLLIATLLPCCTSAAQVEEEEQRACTVIRFQWGHRRIRQERHYGEKERGVTWQHEPTVVRELHLPIVISCHRVRSLGSCSIWFRR